MTTPKKVSPPPAAPAGRTLNERASVFAITHWPTWEVQNVPRAHVLKMLEEFADELLVEAERLITDQHRHPGKLSRLYWQARMDAGREIHELRRGPAGSIVPRPNAEIDDALGTPAEWRKKHNDGGAE